jgi:hypothetical protein
MNEPNEATCLAIMLALPAASVHYAYSVFVNAEWRMLQSVIDSAFALWAGLRRSGKP